MKCFPFSQPNAFLPLLSPFLPSFPACFFFCFPSVRPSLPPSCLSSFSLFSFALCPVCTSPFWVLSSFEWLRSLFLVGRCAGPLFRAAGVNYLRGWVELRHFPVNVAAGWPVWGCIPDFVFPVYYFWFSTVVVYFHVVTLTVSLAVCLSFLSFLLSLFLSFRNSFFIYSFPDLNFQRLLSLPSRRVFPRFPSPLTSQRSRPQADSYSTFTFQFMLCIGWSFFPPASFPPLDFI